MAEQEQVCPVAEPQEQHHWLHRMIGDWSFECEAVMAPDQPPARFTGTEHVRSLGGLWVVGEGRGEMADGAPSASLLTLGYDPARGRFVGTFIASMMTHMWLYDGGLAGNVLTLDTEGPDFSGNPKARFKDVITLESDDLRLMTSLAQGGDGEWRQFMRAEYRRTGR
jgi:Protein of unknown function (DUF1579).